MFRHLTSRGSFRLQTLVVEAVSEIVWCEKPTHGPYHADEIRSYLAVYILKSS